MTLDQYRNPVKGLQPRVFELFNHVWRHTLTQSDTWFQLASYNFLSAALPPDDYEDLRLPVIIFSYTSTGKDLTLNRGKEVLEEVGVNTAMPDSLTDASFVGTIDPDAVKHNRKHGLSHENPVVVTDEGKEIEWRDPVIPGALKWARWIGIPEAGLVFEPNRHAEGIQRFLRVAMDKEREVEKHLALGTIKYKTQAVLFLTSYKFQSIKSILTNGLFQRSMVLFVVLSKDQSREIEDFVIHQKFGRGVDASVVEKYIEELAQELKSLGDWYEGNKKNFTEAEGLDDLMKYKRDQLIETYNSCDRWEGAILDACLRRGVGQIYKLARLHAITQRNTVLEAPDIDNAFKLFQECFRSLQEALRGFTNSDKFDLVITEILKEKGQLSKMKLYDEVMRQMKCSRPTAIRHVKRLISKGILIEEKSGKCRFIRLASSGDKDS